MTTDGDPMKTPKEIADKMTLRWTHDGDELSLRRYAIDIAAVIEAERARADRLAAEVQARRLLAHPTGDDTPMHLAIAVQQCSAAVDEAKDL